MKDVKRLKGSLYCKCKKTGFERLSKTTFTVSDNKTKDHPDLKYLHLNNIDNDVAKAIEEHLKVAYDSAVVQVLKLPCIFANICYLCVVIYHN